MIAYKCGQLYAYRSVAWSYYYLVKIMKISYLCCILTFDPAKHAIPKTAEVHIPLAWVSYADGVEQD